METLDTLMAEREALNGRIEGLKAEVKDLTRRIRVIQLQDRRKAAEAAARDVIGGIDKALAALEAGEPAV